MNITTYIKQSIQKTTVGVGVGPVIDLDPAILNIH